jgi:hypothetical protein
MQPANCREAGYMLIALIAWAKAFSQVIKDSSLIVSIVYVFETVPPKTGDHARWRTATFRREINNISLLPSGGPSGTCSQRLCLHDRCSDTPRGRRCGERAIITTRLGDGTDIFASPALLAGGVLRRLYRHLRAFKHPASGGSLLVGCKGEANFRSFGYSYSTTHHLNAVRVPEELSADKEFGAPLRVTLRKQGATIDLVAIK